MFLSSVAFLFFPPLLAHGAELPPFSGSYSFYGGMTPSHVILEKDDNEENPGGYNCFRSICFKNLDREDLSEALELKILSKYIGVLHIEFDKRYLQIKEHSFENYYEAEFEQVVNLSGQEFVGYMYSRTFDGQGRLVLLGAEGSRSPTMIVRNGMIEYPVKWREGQYTYHINLHLMEN
jgi:hypothetical protein